MAFIPHWKKIYYKWEVQMAFRKIASHTYKSHTTALVISIFPNFKENLKKVTHTLPRYTSIPLQIGEIKFWLICWANHSAENWDHLIPLTTTYFPLKRDNQRKEGKPLVVFDVKYTILVAWILLLWITGHFRTWPISHTWSTYTSVWSTYTSAS